MKWTRFFCFWFRCSFADVTKLQAGPGPGAEGRIPGMLPDMLLLFKPLFLWLLSERRANSDERRRYDSIVTRRERGIVKSPFVFGELSKIKHIKGQSNKCNGKIC